MGEQLLLDSVDLLLYGMGTVFVFLVLLVFATGLMSRLVARYFPESPETAPADSVVDPLTVKVIQAALDKHRGRR